MICLSFDTDHMSERRMAEFCERIGIPGAGTFFCTQPYDCLERAGHELAPHPYLDGKGGHEEELLAKRAEFPQATGWRAHSCVFSHIIAEWLGRNGYRYISTHDQFGDAGLLPVRHPWGIWHMPIYYMDNMDFSRKRFWGEAAGEPFSPHLIERATKGEALFVFDFHPIHLLLNTPGPDHYFAVRDRFKRGDSLESLRYGGYGTESFFRDLCENMTARGLESWRMSAALDHSIATGKVSAS